MMTEAALLVGFRNRVGFKVLEGADVQAFCISRIKKESK